MALVRRFLLVLCLAVVALTPVWSEETPAARRGLRTRNAIVLIMDGVRYTEAWGDPQRKNLPAQAELAKQGVICTHFHNKGETMTNPGHAALTTGFYQCIDNGGSQLPAQPNMFQLWRKATGQPASAAWVITAKDKLFILADSADRAWEGQFTPSSDCGARGEYGVRRYRSDAATWAAAQKTLARDHPRLVLINFKDPDGTGHGGDWNAYLRAIQQTDQYAGQLWRWLQDDPAYAGSTALFVTADHGRHSDGVATGFVDHGCNCEGCRHLPFLALGPDFRQGTVVDTAYESIDLAPTIGVLLGFTVPGARGKVMTALFAAQGASTVPAREATQPAEPVPVPAGR